jgi:hypothetical protein
MDTWVVARFLPLFHPSLLDCIDLCVVGREIVTSGDISTMMTSSLGLLRTVQVLNLKIHIVGSLLVLCKLGWLVPLLSPSSFSINWSASSCGSANVVSRNTDQNIDIRIFRNMMTKFKYMLISSYPDKITNSLFIYFSLFIYSYVQTLFGPFLPLSPHPPNFQAEPVLPFSPIL